jgi:hypothetical protein
VVEPPPKTMTVWLLRSARFRDHNGLTRIARQFDDAEMPVETAQRALGLSVAAPLTDPRRRNLKGARGGDPVDLRAPDIIDLDHEKAINPQQNPSATSNPHTNFIVLDRSAENRTLQIAVPRL